jgi:hypothetical protein
MVRPPTATDTLVLRTASWVYWVVAQNRICTGSSSQLGSDSVFSYGFTELTTPSLIHLRRLSLVATMLSPNDVSLKGKAPSIWSFDSGYGSNTLEDEEQVYVSALDAIVSNCYAMLIALSCFRSPAHPLDNQSGLASAA